MGARSSQSLMAIKSKNLPPDPAGRHQKLAIARSRVREVFFAVRSVFSDEKKLSMAALSQTLPDRLIEQVTPNRESSSVFAEDKSSNSASSRLQSLRLRLTSAAPPAKKINHEMAPERFS